MDLQQGFVRRRYRHRRIVAEVVPLRELPDTVIAGMDAGAVACDVQRRFSAPRRQVTMQDTSDSP
ncbi:hypothetical protein, partial [Pseudoxanthomonas dokdonensis]|uniref:hypothetical protein n=1 Tax=Pseudoxanthomonas dokdonensis TaxID=344882 RepID=UPI001B808EEB